MAENFNNVGVGIVNLISFVSWVLLTITGVYIWIKARTGYSNSGGNKKAKEEARAAAIDQAKQHPDVVLSGAKLAAKGAMQASQV